MYVRDLYENHMHVLVGFYFKQIRKFDVLVAGKEARIRQVLDPDTTGTETTNGFCIRRV